MLSQSRFSKYDRRYSQELQSECMQWIEGSVLFFVANVSLNQTTPTLGTCSPELFRTVRLPSNVGIGPRPLAMHRNGCNPLVWVLHGTSPSIWQFSHASIFWVQVSSMLVSCGAIFFNWLWSASKVSCRKLRRYVPPRTCRKDVLWAGVAGTDFTPGLCPWSPDGFRLDLVRTTVLG